MEYINSKKEFYEFLDFADSKLKNYLIYQWNKFGRILFIIIRNNKIKKFLIFYNLDYENDWHNKIIFNYTTPKEFLKASCEESGYNFLDNECYLPDIKNWRANGFLIRADNKEPKHLTRFYDILNKTLENNKIKDCEFIMNWRDFPISNKFYEPFEEIYGFNSPLNNPPNDLMPIFSMCKKSYFDDILIPTWDDYSEINLDNLVSWEMRKNCAIWRGSTTGYGINIKTNMRLKLVQLAKENQDIIDGKITKWNTRPKIFNKELVFLKKPNWRTFKKLTYETQNRYKYAIIIDGNSAPYQLRQFLMMKMTILLVESNYEMWYTKELIPWTHYIPIKKNLSNLIENVKLCISNDKMAYDIATAGQNFALEKLSYIKSHEFLANQLNKHALLNYNYYK